MGQSRSRRAARRCRVSRNARIEKWVGQRLFLITGARHEEPGERAVRNALGRFIASLSPRARVRCGAFARSTGRPCEAPVTDRPCRVRRCKMHGGAPPRTADALARQLEGLARGRSAQIARGGLGMHCRAKESNHAR